MKQEEILDQDISDQDISDQETNENTNVKKRPIVITVICVLGFIGAAISISIVFSDAAAQVGSWYPPYLFLSSIFGTSCMVGLWKMKKWAAQYYSLVVALNQVLTYEMGNLNIMTLIVLGIVVGIILSHVDKMD